MPSYKTIPMNQSVKWNIIRENIAQLLFTQARCFLLWSRWIALCSRIAVMSWRLWNFIPCECEMPGCWLVTDDDLVFFHRRLEIPTKTFMLRGASILGKEQDLYLKLCRLFHKLTCNSRCYCLDQPGYYGKKNAWDFPTPQTAGSVTRVQLVIHMLHFNSFGESLPQALPAWANYLMSQEEDLLFQRFEPWITSINSGEGLLRCTWWIPCSGGDLPWRRIKMLGVNNLC